MESKGSMTAEKGIIFDMDGVIVDSELHWKVVETAFLSSLLPAWGDSDQSQIIGLSMDHLYSLLVKDYDLQQSREQFLALYNEMANDVYLLRSALLPGVRELLVHLHHKSIPVALASSSPMRWIRLVLDRFHLQEFFRVVVSADDLQGEGKPSPAIYLLTASQLGVIPPQCIVIEDSRNGVLSAKRAQMYCVGLRNGFNEEQDLSQADLIIHNFSEFSQHLFQELLKPD
jgi:HAD superfamily hydrolase (TIGR01509 family)